METLRCWTLFLHIWNEVAAQTSIQAAASVPQYSYQIMEILLLSESKWKSFRWFRGNSYIENLEINDKERVSKNESEKRNFIKLTPSNIGGSCEHIVYCRNIDSNSNTFDATAAKPHVLKRCYKQNSSKQFFEKRFSVTKQRFFFLSLNENSFKIIKMK